LPRRRLAFNKGLFGSKGILGKLENGDLERKDKDGISHNPLEYSSYEDLALGAEVLYGTVLEVLKNNKNGCQNISAAIIFFTLKIYALSPLHLPHFFQNHR